MKIIIELDTDIASDRATWQKLLGTDAPVVKAKAVPTPAPKPEPEEPTPAPEPEPEEPTPAPEPEPEDELLGGPTLADAVSAATTKIQAGKSAEVKAALKTVDAARVSDLKGDKIAGFIAALS